MQFRATLAVVTLAASPMVFGQEHQVSMVLRGFQPENSRFPGFSVVFGMHFDFVVDLGWVLYGLGRIRYFLRGYTAPERC